MSGKNLWAEIFGSKVGKVGYFFSFSNITVEIFILEENFCLHKCRTPQASSFPLFGMSAIIFNRVISKKPAKMLKFTYDSLKFGTHTPIDLI